MGRYDDKTLTFYLFAKPSFSEGVGRVLDLGATYQIYNEHTTEREADIQALKNDWAMVGKDIETAINNYDRESVTAKRS